MNPSTVMKYLNKDKYNLNQNSKEFKQSHLEITFLL